MRAIVIFLLLFGIEVLGGTNVYLKYSSVPKRVYVGQIFRIVLKLTVLDENFEDVEYNFLNEKGLELLSDKPQREMVDEDGIVSTYDTFYLKVLDTEVRLPDVELVSKSAHESLLNIEGKPLPAIQIPAKTKNFSNIYAEKLEVEKLIAHHYDEKHNILNLFLVGEIVNFDLMRFEQPYIKEQGFETPPKPGRFLKNRIVYYVVVPKYYDRFIFKYFNSAKARFETIENPINILDDRVVTAKDIKPTSSDRNRNLKIAILLFVAALFYWLYYKKKGYTYIFFGGLFTMLALQYFIPKAKICVRPGAVVRVLPMTSSTIFTTIKGKKYLEKVYEYGEFIKIKTPNSSEGWIKKKDVCNKD